MNNCWFNLAGGDGIVVTDENFSNFQFYAQYAAASYCQQNDNGTAGTTIECSPAENCPLVQAAGATTLAEFVT